MVSHFFGKIISANFHVQRVSGKIEMVCVFFWLLSLGYLGKEPGQIPHIFSKVPRPSQVSWSEQKPSPWRISVSVTSWLDCTKVTSSFHVHVRLKHLEKMKTLFSKKKSPLFKVIDVKKLPQKTGGHHRKYPDRLSLTLQVYVRWNSCLASPHIMAS